jgi:CheY-like chemotaxis protein
MKKNTSVVSIILCDDDDEDCLYFGEALNDVHSNNTFQYFHSGTDLLQHLNRAEAIPPDILFLDLNMPGMTGKICLTEIRRIGKYSNMPIAIYSTSDLSSDVNDTLASGANIYLGLKSTITKVLDVNWQYHHLNFNMNTYVMAI